MSKIHNLKIESQYFDSINRGHKTFEIRKNDRGYSTLDILILNEYSDRDPSTNMELGEFKPTGRQLAVRVVYITNYMQKDGYVVMGIERI